MKCLNGNVLITSTCQILHKLLHFSQMTFTPFILCLFCVNSEMLKYNLRISADSPLLSHQQLFYWLRFVHQDLAWLVCEILRCLLTNNLLPSLIDLTETKFNNGNNGKNFWYFPFSQLLDGFYNSTFVFIWSIAVKCQPVWVHQH